MRLEWGFPLYLTNSYMHSELERPEGHNEFGEVKILRLFCCPLLLPIAVAISATLVVLPWRNQGDKRC